MERYMKIPRFNSTFDWDETKYNVLYYLYDIEQGPGKHSSFVNTRTSDEHEMSDQFQFYVEGIGILIITILGILGNCISGWVLSRRQMRSPINCLLLGLAVADTIFIFSDLFILPCPTILHYYKVDISVLAVMTPYLFSVIGIAHSASVYLTLAVTIERYVAICHPFKARTNFTWRQATYIVIGIFMGSFIYNLPKWWEFVAIGILDGNNVVVRYVPVTTSLRRNPIYEKYYCYSAYMVLIYSLPLLILILFNVLIYKAVKRANVQRRMLSSSEQSENQIARMLVMVVLVFILCNAMTLVNIAAKIISGSPTITGVDSLRNFSVVLNSCINFVIYCAYGEKFREIFKQMWPLWIQKLCCKTYCNRQRYSQSSRSNSSDKTRSGSLSISTIQTTSFVIEK